MQSDSGFPSQTDRNRLYVLLTWEGNADILTNNSDILPYPYLIFKRKPVVIWTLVDFYKNTRGIYLYVSS